jgi:ABC-2 type transport system permease protein
VFQRIKALTIKEFLHLRHDWWLPLFMLLGGALELVLVGWATSRPMTNLPLMLMDNDNSSTSREIITALENTGTFQLDSIAENHSEIENALINGEVTAVVIIPNGFEADFYDPEEQPYLPVFLNGAESIPAREALEALEGVVRSLDEQILIEQYGFDRDELASFNPSTVVRFNESLNESYYTVPAELALMLEFTVLLFAALAFSREKELGTLEQLLVMPFSSLEIIIGKSIPVIIIGFVDFVFMLFLTNLAFGVPVRGSIALLFSLAVIYLVVELGKGMAISVFSKTQHQAFLLVMLVGMADFMFTGYAAPVESMPEALQLFANVVPAHHWLFIVRGIMLKGSDFSILLPNVLALLGLGSVIMFFSLRYVRKSLN